MKAILFMSLILLISSDVNDADLESTYISMCQSIENKDSCINKNLDSDYYCCMFSVKTEEDGQETSGCDLMINRDKIYFKGEKSVSMYREILGYGMARGQNYDMDFYSSKIECNDVSVVMDPTFYFFSPEEKSILESEDHCLYYHDDYVDNGKKPNDLICQKGKLTKNVTDEGIKCGFYNMTLKLKNGGTEYYQTCYFVNKDDIKAGKLNALVKSVLEEEAFDYFNIDNNDDVSYTFDVTSGKDISASYDPKEGILKNNLKDNNSDNDDNKTNRNETDNDDSEGDETKSDDNKTIGNNSNIIKVFKYFNLLFLILL